MRTWERIATGYWQNGVWAATQVHSKKWRLTRVDGRKDDSVAEFHPSLKACQAAVHATIPILTDAEVTHLARQIVTREVFFANTEEGYKCFEMLIMLGGLEMFDESELKKCAGMYAPMSSAGPIAVNGMPRFFSIKLFHIDNNDRLFDELDRMHDALGFVRTPDPDKGATT